MYLELCFLAEDARVGGLRGRVALRLPLRLGPAGAPGSPDPLGPEGRPELSGHLEAGPPPGTSATRPCSPAHSPENPAQDLRLNDCPLPLSWTPPAGAQSPAISRELNQSCPLLLPACPLPLPRMLIFNFKSTPTEWCCRHTVGAATCLAPTLPGVPWRRGPELLPGNQEVGEAPGISEGSREHMPTTHTHTHSHGLPLLSGAPTPLVGTRSR